MWLDNCWQKCCWARKISSSLFNFITSNYRQCSSFLWHVVYLLLIHWRGAEWMMSAKNYLKALKRIKPSLYTCLVNSPEIVTSCYYLFISPPNKWQLFSMCKQRDLQTMKLTKTSSQNFFPLNFMTALISNVSMLAVRKADWYFYTIVEAKRKTVGKSRKYNAYKIK